MPMAPRSSVRPEGAAVLRGIETAMAVSTALLLLGALLAGTTPFKPGRAFAMAGVACVAATLGHLVMKAIKRDRGVPHWGLQTQGVTGASGLLDRVSALAFAAPVFFQSVRWTFGV